MAVPSDGGRRGVLRSGRVLVGDETNSIGEVMGQIQRKPDDSSGFNVDGPPLIVEYLASLGLISPWKSYWYGTSVPIQTFTEYSAGSHE